MYELSRVRLRSVGPAGARFHDVLLDLRGAGRPVAYHQSSVFNDAQQLLRPSPASVFLLENGGGKTVLLRLIFSVLLPGRRQTLGTTNTRVLDNFVLAKDVSHIVLEWMDARTGKLLLTGKVMEWRQQVASSVVDSLVERWYCLRPNDKLSLDTLPFRAEGQPLRLGAYKKDIHELYAADQSLELTWFRHQGDWRERLQQLDIDPELFRYQRAMNVDEGEAAGALTLDSDAKFVDFLLSIVVRTEELDPLAALVDEHVKKLANRGALVTEREFVAGSLNLLGPIEEASHVLTDSVHTHEEAERALARVTAQVRARAEAEEGALKAHAEASERSRQDAVRAAEHSAECRMVRTEFARLLAEMRLAEAHTKLKNCDTHLGSAEAELAAWTATPVVLEHDASLTAVKQLTALVEETEEKARPAFTERDDAARRLARALLAAADEAATADTEEREQAALHKARRDAASATARKEFEAAATMTAKADHFHDEISGTSALVATAVAEGLLPDADALPSHLAEVREKLAGLSDCITRLEEEREELADHETKAQDELRDAMEEASKGKQAQDAAQSRYEEAIAGAKSLQNDSRVVQLLDLEQIELDRDAEQIRSRLIESLSTAERDVTALNAAEYADERARLALATGELLPPPAIVTDACALLKEAEIHAIPGWQYLANVPDQERRRAWVRQLPHLAAGVLLNDPADQPKAERLLATLRPKPTFHVAMATTRAFEEALAEAVDGTPMTIPLHPALHDSEAAAAEHQEIERRHTERTARLTALRDQCVTDRRLLHNVEEWRSRYPAGALAALEQQYSDAAHLREKAETAVTARRNAVTILKDRREKTRRDLPPLRDAEMDLGKRERRLAELSELHGRIPEWTEKEKKARTEGETHRKVAEEAEKLANKHQEQMSEHERRADEARRTVRSLTDRRAKLPGCDDVSLSDPVPELSVALLESDYERAAEICIRVAVGSDLLKEKSDAEERATRAKGPYLGLDDSVRVRAAELVNTPQGSDAAARAAAKDSATRVLEARRQAKEDAAVVVSRCKDHRDEATKQVTGPVDLPERPSDIPGCLAAAERAAAREAAAVQDHTERVEEHDKAKRRFEKAKTAAQAFRFIVGTVGDAPEPGPDIVVEPYAGDAESAQHTYTELRGTASSAAATRQTNEENLQARASALQQHVNAEEFKDLLLPVQTQIRVSGWRKIADHAQEWTKALHRRLLSLDDDLGQTERHRRLIVENLRGLVVNALDTLRRAQRVSRLPDTLGDWSGEEFLRFRFQRSGDEHLTEMLAEVIDEAAAGQTADGRTVKRDGMSLLLRGVRAAAPRGFHVDVLKPDAVLRTERVRVSEIKDVFSGGQVLTTAILLYCTMAALRANERGRRVQDSHAGVLFLDNPIGRANADYLLDLQRKVAEALGVQLIYTTGLSDDSTFKRFPLVLRLRNDADLRTGRKYLTVADRVQEHLDALGPPDGGGRITATRIMRRDTDDEEPAGRHTTGAEGRQEVDGEEEEPDETTGG